MNDSGPDYGKVFFLSSHGMAGDHWFDWLPKSINSHSEILLYIGESVRSKYLKERSRQARPALLSYVKFLDDVGGATYQGVGDCFSYRSYQLEELNHLNLNIPWLNIVRHPYAWLYFYISWRVNNMNMNKDDTSAVDHEWRVTWHHHFKALPIRAYKKEDIHVWAAYQGMAILNRMITDLNKAVINIPMERIVVDKMLFKKIISILTGDRVEFSGRLVDQVYADVYKPYRGTKNLLEDPLAYYHKWPDWKREAFDAIVKKQTLQMFEDHGYELR